jgi:hypothetical protein
LVVVRGTLEVIKGQEAILLTDNQLTCILIVEKHRLANPWKIPAFLRLAFGISIGCGSGYWITAFAIGPQKASQTFALD